MRLQERTDYALRTLMYLAIHDAGRVSAGSVARAFDVSEAHLSKVAQALVHAGFVETTAGRTGGMRLARPAADISVGAVVRALEPIELVECFRTGGRCTVLGACGLEGRLALAAEAFLATLDGVTIADAAASEALRGRLR